MAKFNVTNEDAGLFKAQRITGNKYTDIMQQLELFKSQRRGIVIVDIELSRGINITFM